MKLTGFFLLAFLIAFMPTISSADFVGTIGLSNSVVEATGVTYTFNLRFTRPITDTGGKLVIRFPQDFETEFTVAGCTSLSGFSVAAG
jgi:hypothetical protein